MEDFVDVFWDRGVRWVDRYVVIRLVGEEKDNGERGAATRGGGILRQRSTAGWHFCWKVYRASTMLDSTHMRAHKSETRTSLAVSWTPRPFLRLFTSLFRKAGRWIRFQPSSKTTDFATEGIVAKGIDKLLHSAFYSTSDTGLTSFRALVLRYRNNWKRRKRGKTRASYSRSKPPSASSKCVCTRCVHKFASRPNTARREKRRREERRGEERRTKISATELRRETRGFGSSRADSKSKARRSRLPWRNRRSVFLTCLHFLSPTTRGAWPTHSHRRATTRAHRGLITTNNR